MKDMHTSCDTVPATIPTITIAINIAAIIILSVEYLDMGCLFFKHS